MSGQGHDRSFGDVSSMSGLRESGHDWAIYEYTSLVSAARYLGSLAFNAQQKGLRCAAIV
jgi:hypothetical protein